MARKAMLGRQVRRLRRTHKLSQVALARQLGISASYLNLIEHNQRPLTAALQAGLAEALGVDLKGFSQDEDSRLLAELRELFGDPLFGDSELAEPELRDLIETAPGIGRSLQTLYRGYRGARDDVLALGERLSSDSFLSTSPHELRTLLTSIRSFSEILMDYDDLEPEKRRQFIGILVNESQRLSLIINQMLDYATGPDTAWHDRAALPADEVSDLLQERGNHFPELEAAARAFRAEAGLGTPVEAAALARALERRLHIETVVVGAAPPGQEQRVGSQGDGSQGSGSQGGGSQGGGSQSGVSRARLPGRPAGTLPGGLRHFDAEAGVLLLSDTLPARSRCFEMARCAGLARHGELIDSLLQGASLTSEDSRRLAREVLAGAFAAAVLMPYEAFAEAADACRHDIEALQGLFSTSFEQCCQRLSTLNRPGARGLPFHFLRVDLAGNLSKRFTASGLQIARFGGVCPRMAVHQAFLAPGRIATQIERMPDGSRYFDIARVVTKPGASYREPRSHFAIALGCEIGFARDLAYAEGLDLEAVGTDVPVGPTCSLCERLDCRQRATPPILPSLRRAAAGGAGA